MVCYCLNINYDELDDLFDYGNVSIKFKTYLGLFDFVIPAVEYDFWFVLSSTRGLKGKMI